MLQNNRIKGKIVDIKYDDTLNFFSNRANKYRKDNPYSVTMYQDNNPKLVEDRNKAETDKLLPYLNLDDTSVVLDIACGIGRWSDAIKTPIKFYYGMDFSKNLIDIANNRNTDTNRKFFVGSVLDIEKIIEKHFLNKVNRILLIGILMYLNDEDLSNLAQQILNVSDGKTIICIREPIGLQGRLTLQQFYSEELNDTYNAIYRSPEEIKKIFIDILIDGGFNISEEKYLFEDALNNRKETAQYYFILERK